MRSQPLNVGIIHEWLSSVGGSERVVEQFLQLYPDSQLYTTVDFLPEQERGMLGGRPVKTTFIQRMPFARKHFRGYLPLMPLAVEQHDLAEHDVIISSNHAVAKGVITRPGQLHVCYIHTPIRYAWDMQGQYLQTAGLTKTFRGMVARTALHYLRMWDCLAAKRVDAFVANSRFVAERVRKCYGRKSRVIYPPVDVDNFGLEEHKHDYYLAASRLVPYKRVDLIVDAFRHMPDKRLIVIGDGPMFKHLKARAPANVELLCYQPHDVLKRHLQQAKAFVFAAEEDFGILPVEAQACGTPVVAFGRGGSLETVVEGTTGFFFFEQTPEAVADAVRAFETAPRLDPREIRHHALSFSPERFRREMNDYVQHCWRRLQQRSQRSPLAGASSSKVRAAMQKESL